MLLNKTFLSKNRSIVSGFEEKERKKKLYNDQPMFQIYCHGKANEL